VQNSPLDKGLDGASESPMTVTRVKRNIVAGEVTTLELTLRA